MASNTAAAHGQAGEMPMRSRSLVGPFTSVSAWLKVAGPLGDTCPVTRRDRGGRNNAGSAADREGAGGQVITGVGRIDASGGQQADIRVGPLQVLQVRGAQAARPGRS